MSNEHARSQAMAQMAYIRELVRALRTAQRDDDNGAARYEAGEAIQQDALSVEVRSRWTMPGAEWEASEYRRN